MNFGLLVIFLNCFMIVNISSLSFAGKCAVKDGTHTRLVG